MAISPVRLSELMETQRQVQQQAKLIDAKMQVQQQEQAQQMMVSKWQGYSAGREDQSNWVYAKILPAPSQFGCNQEETQRITRLIKELPESWLSQRKGMNIADVIREYIADLRRGIDHWSQECVKTSRQRDQDICYLNNIIAEHLEEIESMKRIRTFPLMLTEAERDFETVRIPNSLPWAMIAGLHKEIKVRYGKTPLELAERGGLTTKEALALLNGVSQFDSSVQKMTLGQVLRDLKGRIDKWKMMNESLKVAVKEERRKK